jgi:hypothetical protein
MGVPESPGSIYPYTPHPHHKCKGMAVSDIKELFRSFWTAHGTVPGDSGTARAASAAAQ